jgi:prepilin-type N-terminal cleavage/methylation domain-containing protein
MKKTSKKGAFTLIELLVVISILAILAAIIYPVIARHRHGIKSAPAPSGSRSNLYGGCSPC